MSNRQLKKKIDKYQQSEMSLSDWNAEKRKLWQETGSKLLNIQCKIEVEKVTNKKNTKEVIANDIKKVMEELNPIHFKHDYSKLLKKF